MKIDTLFRKFVIDTVISPEDFFLIDKLTMHKLWIKGMNDFGYVMTGFEKLKQSK